MTEGLLPSSISEFFIVAGVIFVAGKMHQMVMYHKITVDQLVKSSMDHEARLSKVEQALISKKK